MKTEKFLFEEVVEEKEGFLRGPFGSDLKKSLFVEKGIDTYKVYEQGVVLENNQSIGKYYISKKYFEEKMKKFEVKPGDFLVSCSGVNYGAIIQLQKNIEKGIINQALLRIRINKEIVDEDFFLYYFKCYISKVITGGTGDSTIPNFPPMSVIKNIELSLPNITVQKKIGNILKNIDQKIHNNNQINNNLEELMKAIYQRWFIEFEFPNANGLPYKSSGGKLVYNEKLKQQVPENWNVSTIGDLLSELECGDRPVGGSYEEGIPSIGAENIIGIGKYNFKNEKYIPIEYFNSMKSGIIRNWDVLLYKDGAGVGQVSMVGDNFPYRDCAINSHVFILRSKDSVYQSYLYLTLCQIHIKKMLIALAMKAAQPGLNQPAVKSIKTIIPPREILEKFNKYCDITFHKIFCNANENKELNKLKEYLLPLLMNGQINVDDIEI